jgi:hypothetical protein
MNLELSDIEAVVVHDVLEAEWYKRVEDSLEESKSNKFHVTPEMYDILWVWKRLRSQLPPLT